jgi:Zn finger protein HypA/HybF involved in hydrogenase expression
MSRDRVRLTKAKRAAVRTAIEAQIGRLESHCLDCEASVSERDRKRNRCPACDATLDPFEE